MDARDADDHRPVRADARGGRAEEFIDAFEYAADPPHVIIDMSRAHVWDASAVAALDAIEHHYDRHDVEVTITGLNSHSHALHNTLSGQTAAAHS